MKRVHRMPFGAIAHAEGACFRLWAPSAFDGETLQVRWPLAEGGTLRLRARLVPTAGAPAPALPGATLYATHPADAGAPAAWSVRWHLETGRDA